MIRTALKCKICSVVIIRNTIQHLRKEHDFKIRDGQSNRSKQVRKSIEKSYFKIVEVHK